MDALEWFMYIYQALEYDNLILLTFNIYLFNLTNLLLGSNST